MVEQPEREGVVGSWVPPDPSGRDTGNVDVSSMLTPATSISGPLVKVSGEAGRTDEYRSARDSCLSSSFNSSSGRFGKGTSPSGGRDSG